MKTVRIPLNSIDKVKSFVNDLAKFDVDFEVQYHGKYFPGIGGDLKSFDELMEFVRQHEEFVKSHGLLD